MTDEMRSANRLTGTLSKIFPDFGYGFLVDHDNKSYFFHRSQCLTPFETLHVGMAVYFEPDTQSPNARAKGPRALQVAAIG